MSLTSNFTVATAILTVLALGACDLDDKSLGDTGADETIGGETQDTSDSDPTSDPTGMVCTNNGCNDGFFLTLLSADDFPDGNYELQISEGEASVFSCDFGIEGGAVNDAECDVGSVTSNSLSIALPPTASDISIDLSIDGEYAGGGVFDLSYEDVQPNGPGCEPICSQASAELSVGMPSSGETCEALQVAFAEEFEAVRGCDEASECGQVLSGFSCGCTQDWVGRLDADPEGLYELAEDAQTLACAWADWVSTCDCPETDGFACIDNICQWSYVAGE